jgi:hypothetical protein
MWILCLLDSPIWDCLPDGPNETRNIFQIVGGTDTAAGHFLKIL